MYQDNCSIVLFLQYSPFGLDPEVIAYTESEVYVKRPDEEKSWRYRIKIHLVTGIKSKIPNSKFRNHSLPTRIVKREGNAFTLQVIPRTGQLEYSEYEGQLIKIETKSELIPDFEKLLERLDRSFNKIRSAVKDKNKPQDEKDELLKSTDLEICKLLKIIEIGSMVFDEEKLKCILVNLVDLEKSFRGKDTIPIPVPKKLTDLIGEYKQQLKEINHFNEQG